MRALLFAISFICALFGIVFVFGAIAASIFTKFGLVLFAMGAALIASSIGLSRLRKIRYPPKIEQSSVVETDMAQPKHAKEPTIVPALLAPAFVLLAFFVISREESIFIELQRYNTSGRFTSYYLQVFAAEALMITLGAVAAIRTFYPIGMRYSITLWSGAFAMLCLAFRYTLERHNEYIHFGLLMNISMIVLGIGLVLQLAKKLSGP